MKWIVVVALLSVPCFGQSVGYVYINSDDNTKHVYLDGADLGQPPYLKWYCLSTGTHTATIIPSSVRTVVSNEQAYANQAAAYSYDRGLFSMVVSARTRSNARQWQQIVDNATVTVLVQPDDSQVIFVPAKDVLEDIRIQSMRENNDPTLPILFTVLLAGIVALIAIK